ncbi:hypothetical protein HMPREF9148_02417 [Prevotella sp. F0091]|nr:hypothetical protein HMPREF9148_02417 [Prevotella sp. F0091]
MGENSFFSRYTLIFATGYSLLCKALYINSEDMSLTIANCRQL